MRRQPEPLVGAVPEGALVDRALVDHGGIVDWAIVHGGIVDWAIVRGGIVDAGVVDSAAPLDRAVVDSGHHRRRRGRGDQDR